MAISYPISLPTNKSAANVTVRARTSVSVTRSPFTGERQAQKHQGQWWEAEVTLPPMKRSDAEPWTSFLVKLNGMEGTFLLGDYAASTPRGTAASSTASPTVDTGSAANTLNLKNGPTNTTGYLLPGDYIQLGSGASSRLFKVLEAADTDGSGNVALTIWPEINNLNEPSEDDSITVTNAKGVFQMVANSAEWQANPSQYGIVFAAISII